jgi:hypothetical protein
LREEYEEEEDSMEYIKDKSDSEKRNAKDFEKMGNYSFNIYCAVFYGTNIRGLQKRLFLKDKKYLTERNAVLKFSKRKIDLIPFLQTHFIDLFSEGQDVFLASHFLKLFDSKASIIQKFWRKRNNLFNSKASIIQKFWRKRNIQKSMTN